VARGWRAVAVSALLGFSTQTACLGLDEELDDLSSDEAIGEDRLEVTGANLGGANLGGANLGGANMAGVNLGGANLGGANLGGANLGGANLGGANLAGNNLGGNNLSSTNLGGANLGGANLAGANLAGVNLAAAGLNGSTVGGTYTTLGCPVTGTVRLGTDLTLSTVGINIHNLGTTLPNKLLRSREDRFTRASSCVMLGIGSTAFARLVSQNSGATMYAALKKLPWGFAVAAGGPVVLSAWEVIVWGSSRYSVFVMVAPPEVTFAGAAGFIKAIWRWTAPPTKTLKIGQIGGGEAVTSYTGMMNAGTKLLDGTIRETAYVGGELSFITATTNNRSVNVDFASWVAREGSGNNPFVLGRPVGTPTVADAVYTVIQVPGGKVAAHARAFGGAPSSPAWNSLSAADVAYRTAGSGVGKPTAKRCFGALQLHQSRPTVYLRPTTQCDSFALSQMAVAVAIGPINTYSTRWSTTDGTVEYYMGMESANGVANYRVPITPGTLGCSSADSAYANGFCWWPSLGETYVHLNEPAFTVAGEGAAVRITGAAVYPLTSSSTAITVPATITNVGTVALKAGAWTARVRFYGTTGMNLGGQSPALPVTVPALAPGASHNLSWTGTVSQGGTVKVELFRNTLAVPYQEDSRKVTTTGFGIN
jgi:hypothetical protein